LGTPISQDDYRAFIKPYEGLKHLSEIRSTLKPEEIVEPSVPKPIRARVVDFPLNPGLPESETRGFLALHGTLRRIVTAQTRTFAIHDSLKRRRKNLLNFLWVFGHRGRLKGTVLEIDSSTLSNRDEFGNIVRKRDNALHSPAKLALAAVKELGISGEHIPEGRNDWLLRLSFDDRAGGRAALRALADYTSALVAQHGEPEYVGSSKYKGEAFKRFAAADMHDIVAWITDR
jgi:hypothetical protein